MQWLYFMYEKGSGWVSKILIKTIQCTTSQVQLIAVQLQLSGHY